jgi:hypothetical protein
VLAIEVSGAPTTCCPPLGRKEDGSKTREKVLKKTIEEFVQKAPVAGDGAEVRHLAYAKDTPPKWATWPTLAALQPTRISDVDARISVSFEGKVTHKCF